MASLLEKIIEYNVRHPLIIEALEHQVIFNAKLDRVVEICRIVEQAKKSGDMFSKRFFDIIFQKGLNLIPTLPASDVVKIIKVFEDRADYVS